MNKAIEHMEIKIREAEEKADDMRKELLRLESYIWGMKSAQAIAAGCANHIVFSPIKGTYGSHAIVAERCNEAG